MPKGKSKHHIPGEADFFRRLEARHRRGRLGRLFNTVSIGACWLGFNRPLP